MPIKDGKWLETLVEQMGAQYNRTGRARWVKVDPPTRNLGKRVINLPNPFLDFIGSWTERDGRHIQLECKSTKERRLSINRHGGVTEKQFEALNSWEKSGAAVGIIWGFENKIRFVTMALAHAVLSEGKASIRWEMAYKIPPGEGILTPGDILKILGKVYP